MSIGLDFVKKIDKNWDKHLISIDNMTDEGFFEKLNHRKDEEYKKSDDINVEKNLDYWKFWKKRYSIIR
jgi:hypothetical protein